MKMNSLLIVITLIAAFSVQTADAEIITFAGVDGSEGSVSQSIEGGTVTTSWRGTFNEGATSGQDLGFNNRQIGFGQNFATVTFVPDAGYETSAFFDFASQRNHTGANTARGIEFGVLSSDGTWRVTDQSGLAGSLSGSGTSTLNYGNLESDQRGSFDAVFTGTTFTYAYSVSEGSGSTSRAELRDPFTLNIIAQPIIATAAVPEPTSIALLGLAGLGFLTRRKRS